MNFLTNTVVPRFLSGINFICHHVEGVNKIVLYIFPFIKFFHESLCFQFLLTLSLFWNWGGVCSVDYEFRTSPEHSLAFLNLRFPPHLPNQLVYPLTVSHFLLIFQKSGDFICFLVNPFPILFQLWIYSFLFLHERTEVGLPPWILHIIFNLTSFV